MYADDTAISLSSKNIDDLQNDLNLDLLKLQDWLHANKLSLNVVKTQSLIIGSGPNIRKIESQPDAPPSFSIGDQDIEMITNARYLGVQIDSKLNWDRHIDTIKTKANRALGLIKYSKKYLPSDVLNNPSMYRVRIRISIDMTGLSEVRRTENGRITREKYTMIYQWRS